MTPATEASAPPARHGLDDAIVTQASRWMARLWSGDAGEKDHAACAQWRAAHPDHEVAWQRLQAMEAKFGNVPPGVARRALRDAAAAPARRRVLTALCLAAGAGAVYPLARQVPAWQALAADMRSVTGEIRVSTLPDGTRLTLDTASAIDLRYDAHERRIVLRRGRILLETASDPAGRPLRVESAQGTVQALGTTFCVQQDDGLSRVMVYEGAVDIRPAHAPGVALRTEAGQQAVFSAHDVQASQPLDNQDAAWRRGQLVAQDMRLSALLDEVGRYRPGLLRHDPTLSELRVTGVFSLSDTDRTLASLAEGLNLKLVTRTRYWVSLMPR